MSGQTEKCGIFEVFNLNACCWLMWNLNFVALIYLKSCLKSFKCPNSWMRIKDSKYDIS